MEREGLEARSCFCDAESSGSSLVSGGSAQAGEKPQDADRLFSLTQFASPAPPSPLYLLSSSSWGCNKASLLLTIFSHFQENLILPTP